MFHKHLSKPILLSITLLVGMYSATTLAELRMVHIDNLSMAQIKKMQSMGMDITQIKPQQGSDDDLNLKFQIDIVISTEEETSLRRDGYQLREIQPQSSLQRGLSIQRFAARSATSYFDFDTAGSGLYDQILQLEQDYPGLVTVHEIGRSLNDRPILAVNVTSAQGSRANPEVLYVHTMHAREWVSPYVGMRILRHLLDNYGSDDRVTNIVDNISFWSIPVQNPDGYQYTHTTERLWRKNLRDNNGDGSIDNNDGVDLNRNWGSHWGLDNEGSSENPSSATYRGPRPFSEPANIVLRDFILAHDFKYTISYHTYSNLILYPVGWQLTTPSIDDALFVAQSGVIGNATIFDRLVNDYYRPSVSADLYTTNGEFSDWAYEEAGVPAYTVELTLGDDGAGSAYGFVFPDDADMLNTVFEDNLEFALAVIESADTPANPVSPLGYEAQNIYHVPVDRSYGEDQRIIVTARTKKKGMRLYYTINGDTDKVKFQRSYGKDFNSKSGVHYDRFEAIIEDQKPGDEVSYWIVRKGEQLGPYNYQVGGGHEAEVLLLAAEDYSTGLNNAPAYLDNTQPNYLHFYTDALDAAEISYNVYDMDAELAVPSIYGTLCNHEAVIWYTGNDFASRAIPNFEGHTQTILAIRDYLNFCDGKVLVTGQGLSYLSTVFGVTPDDFFQYSLGSFTTLASAGQDDSGVAFDLVGIPGDPVFDGVQLSLQGGTGADNQVQAASFLLTSYFLPNFDFEIAAKYDRPGNPFGPTSGQYYVYSQQSDVAYKRMGGTYSLPASGDLTMSFQMSHDIEADWDYAAVEIRSSDADNWTTLPDLNGGTTTAPGSSCTSDWQGGLHPHLKHYMTLQSDGSCLSDGTTGEWNGITGQSGGWRLMEFDLSAYAGQTVEIQISYITDWGTQNLGVFVDDVTIPGQGLNDFEAGLGYLTISSEAESAVAPNNWVRLVPEEFPEGPVLRSDDTVYLGFGFEAIASEANRNAVMKNVMKYFLDDDDDDDEGDDDEGDDDEGDD